MFVNKNVSQIIMNLLDSEKSTEKIASQKYSVDEAKQIAFGLAKVAVFPCNEKVYDSVQEIMKTASECMTDVIMTLDSVQKRNEDLEKAAEVKCLMDQLISSGMVDDGDIEDKVAELMKKDQNDLNIIKEAIKIAQSGNRESLLFDNNHEEISKTGSKRGIFEGVIE